LPEVRSLLRVPERIQLFIGARNETLSVVAMRIYNPDPSPVGVNR
jgi:hypothetical protein